MHGPAHCTPLPLPAYYIAPYPKKASSVSEPRKWPGSFLLFPEHQILLEPAHHCTREHTPARDGPSTHHSHTLSISLNCIMPQMVTGLCVTSMNITWKMQTVLRCARHGVPAMFNTQEPNRNVTSLPSRLRHSPEQKRGPSRSLRAPTLPPVTSLVGRKLAKLEPVLHRSCPK